MRHPAHRNKRAGRSKRTTGLSRWCWTDASRRATLLWHRLYRHGVGCGAVIKLPGERGPLPCPPSSAWAGLYSADSCDGRPPQAMACRTPIAWTFVTMTRSSLTGVGIARASLAALQGGQAAPPHPSSINNSDCLHTPLRGYVCAKPKPPPRHRIHAAPGQRSQSATTVARLGRQIGSCGAKGCF